MVLAYPLTINIKVNLSLLPSSFMVFNIWYMKFFFCPRVIPKMLILGQSHTSISLVVKFSVK